MSEGGVDGARAGADLSGRTEARRSQAGLFHLVYLRSGPVLLSRKPYADWREIQDEWDDYMTSLGPWTAEDVVEFFREDFRDEADWPFTAGEVAAFAASDRVVMRSDP